MNRKKKGPSWCLILLGVAGEGLTAWVSGVIDVAFDLPEVLGHRAAAARGVLLGLEGDLVRGDLGEVFATVSNCCRYGSEAFACIEFVARRHGAALLLFADEEAVTVGVSGGCGAVRAEKHVLAAVLRVRTRFC